jgi:hypothetical protein
MVERVVKYWTAVLHNASVALENLYVAYVQARDLKEAMTPGAAD